MLERTSVCLEQGRSFQMICSEVSFRHLVRVRVRVRVRGRGRGRVRVRGRVRG